ncbi:hypothetical protein AGMMS49940_06300 [Spirochaetia bacterium]|nr:hypothetical protein AGMMS49940_06300 [Spirochaetia bacterium]
MPDNTHESGLFNCRPVIDLSTGIANAAIHPNANISVVGSRLKVEGPSPLNGIYFSDGNIAPIRVPDSAISVNNPKKLTFIAPDLPPGDYTLHVITQYTGKDPSKVP